MFIEGVRNLVHAVDRGWTIRTLVFSKRLLTSAPARQRVRALRARGVPAIQLSPEAFRRVSRAEHASGVGLGPDVDPFDPTIVRASMGALFAQTLVRTSHAALRDWIARHRAMVVGAAPDADLGFQHLRYREPTLLLLGNERKGLSPAQRALSNH